MSFSLRQLTDFLQGTLVNLAGRDPAEILLEDVASFPVATVVHLTYAESQKQVTAFKSCQAGAVITTRALADQLTETTVPLILVETPQKSFIDAMLLMRTAPARTEIGVSGRAVVDPTAQIGAECRVAAGAVIGKRVVLGERCEITAGVIIGDDCRIGDDCLLYPNAVLYPRCELGNRVIVHSNAVIGADGFGYRFAQGAYVKIPHTGKVILEDDVEIGACTTVDRGMIEPTVIGTGSKIDNQVMIGHNCRIGKHNAFASQVGLAGSVSTGDYVQMAGQVGVADHIHIGTKVILGAQCGVMDDLVTPGLYLTSPALPQIDAFKTHANIRRIPDLRQQLKQLAKQVADLEARLAQSPAPISQKSAA